MSAETVKIDVQPSASDKSLGQARVTADFTMHNTGDAAEDMAVRFPIGASDGFFKVNELHDLQVKVNGQPIRTRRIDGEDPYNGSDPVPWAEFDVAFPPGQDVPVEVQYTLEASGEYPFIWFKYVLSTGAAWKDTIGSADIIVQLPYPADIQNILTDSPGIVTGTTPGGALNGNSLRWHYENLEPTTQDNFEVNLVMPAAWQRLLTEQKNVTANPLDGEAWGRLGKLCKEMAFSSRGKGFRVGSMDPGAAELYDRSLQAYERAVTLLPKDAQWHAGYADALAYHAYFKAFEGADTTEEALHSMREIQTALALSPHDPKVQEIAQRIASSFPDAIQHAGDAYVFSWLTATPPAVEVGSQAPTEIAQVQAASETPTTVPTSTLQQLPTASAAAPVSKPSAPFCGSALIFPMLLGGLLLAGNAKRRN